VVLSKGGKRGDGAIQVGLPDGRVAPLTTYTAQIRRGLNLYDVVYVHVIEGRAPAARTRGRAQTEKTRALPSARAEIRVRPTVQGATLVLENKTGRILAMAGSFSYPLSQLNRTWQTERQPGSAVKPLTYLTALQKGLQPNTLIPNDPITLPPIGSRGSIVSYGSEREEDFWTPRNAGYSSGGVYTLRRGLENSVNMVTAHLLDGGIDSDPEKSLDDVCATAVAAKIYKDCIRYYPFVLGAQPVHMIDLAAFYAAIANEGMRPQPHAIDSVEQNGRVVYEYPKVPVFPMIGAADRASFYQLKTILQGVVARGTARSIASLSPYVAGKTGTTEDAVDGWFVGFTNDVTIAVWVGYDNGDGKRRSLGAVDGARVALPIFQPIMNDVWADHIAPKAPLAGPSAEAKRQLLDLPIDYYSGDFERGGGNFIEHFRVGSDGRIADTQYSMLSREEADLRRQEESPWANNGEPGSYGYEGRQTFNGRSYYPDRGPQGGPPQPFGRGFFGNWGNQYPAQPQQPQGPTARGFFTPWSSNPAYQ
jgi:penicillin-binding protein 1A